MNHEHTPPHTTYTCPMHPDVVKDKPGMCPLCGMSLIPAQTPHITEHGKHPESNASEYQKHAGHKTASFLQKFWVVFALTIPILAYSTLAEKLGFIAPPFPGSHYMMLALGSVVFFYGGSIFLTSAYRELRARLPGMMTLIALAITAAYAFSVFSVVSGVGENLFWELATLIGVMLLGHYIEMRAVQGAQGALKELAKLLPDTAEVVRGGVTSIIPISELVEGDTVLVKPGSKIPADGTIIEGRSELDESIITGESKPITKSISDEVIAGSINGDGTLTIKVAHIGEHTFLAGVMRLVADAQASKSRLQMLSDRAAFYLTIIAIIAGVITFITWLIAGEGFTTATERLVAVLVIACPHALGLAIPLVASTSTTMAARNGLLVRQRLALEAARSIDIVLFDKTGTLTLGAFGIDTIVPFGGTSENEILRLAASINSYSEHPIAKAFVREAEKRAITLAPVADFERLAGRGAKGVVGGIEVTVGNDTLLAERSLAVPDVHRAALDTLARQGKTVVHLIAGGNLRGSIALADIIRDESREAIRTLKNLNIKVAMITGDSDDVAACVAGELGVDEYFARVLPSQKSEKVKLLQEKGFKVAMVGDGVNDAPALTQADLGIAIGAGTNVAIESAGIVLVKNDPRDIPKIIRLSKLTYTKMIQNLWWATGYNIIALPLAAGVLAYKGIILQPAVAAVFMSLSTVIVAFNAVLLRKQTL